MNRKKTWIKFIFIVVITIFSLLIDLPRLPDWLPGSNWFTKQKFHLGLDLQGGTELVYQADMSKIPKKQRASAIAGARDIIERRVNVFGVTEPIITTAKVGENWRINVQLPGIKNIDEAIKMIGETPILDFREQTKPRELTENERKQLEIYNQRAKERAEDILNEVLKNKSNFSSLAKKYSEDEISKEKGGDLGWFKKGEMVPEFEKVVEKLKEGEIAKTLIKTEFGYHIIKKTGERINKNGEEEFRASHILIRTKSEEEIVGSTIKWQYTGLTGKQLKSAIVTFNPQTNEPEVALEFNSEGAKLFAKITKRNVGKPVAIFLDNYPISIPIVKEPILNGKAVISGKFDIKEARELAQRLSAGALPVPIKLVSQKTVGATLGWDSVKKSFIAGLIGFLMVIIFMIFFYRVKGLIASVALFIYVLIVLAIFKIVPVTLTLAGIAGFILSIGMAVDANVLIFERIKDEESRGKKGKTAIDDGFSHAWSAIRDSNITTLIVCFILFEFATGLVKGFGLTLGIGVLISMFSAIIITKTLLDITTRYV